MPRRKFFKQILLYIGDVSVFLHRRRRPIHADSTASVPKSPGQYPGSTFHPSGPHDSFVYTVLQSTISSPAGTPEYLSINLCPARIEYLSCTNLFGFLLTMVKNNQKIRGEGKIGIYSICLDSQSTLTGAGFLGPTGPFKAVAKVVGAH